MWIFFSLLATFSQVTRNLFSKKIVNEYPMKAIVMGRFLFAIPLVSLAYFIIGRFSGYPVIISWHFFLWTTLMAISQVLASCFRISLFNYKSFAVSLTIVQVDTILIAIIGVLFLKEFLNLYAWLGLIIATTGLILASLSKGRVSITNLRETLFTKASLIAFLTGLFLALAGIFVKKAFNYVEGSTKIVTSLFTLTIILLTEIGILLPFLLKDFKSIKLLIKKPLKPMCIGICSALGSFGWLTAYSLTYLAYVRTVGQLEFILASLLSVHYFKEKLYRQEVLGMILVSAGTLILVFLKD